MLKTVVLIKYKVWPQMFEQKGISLNYEIKKYTESVVMFVV